MHNFQENPDEPSSAPLRVANGFYAGEDIDILIKALLTSNKCDINKAYLVSTNGEKKFIINNYILPAMALKESTGQEGGGHLEELISKIIQDSKKAQILIPYKLPEVQHWITVFIQYDNSTFSVGAYDSLGHPSSGVQNDFIKIIQPKAGNLTIMPLSQVNIQIQKGNVYCGGYTGRIIVDLAINSESEFFKIEACSTIALFQKEHKDNDYRVEDAGIVRKFNLIFYDKFAVKGDGAPDKETQNISDKKMWQVHKKYNKEFKTRWKALTTEQRQKISEEYKNKEKEIREALKDSHHNYQKIKNIYILFKDFCTNDLKLKTEENPFSIFFKQNALKEINGDISSLDDFWKNYLKRFITNSDGKAKHATNAPKIETLSPTYKEPKTYLGRIARQIEQMSSDSTTVPIELALPNGMNIQIYKFKERGQYPECNLVLLSEKIKNNHKLAEEGKLYLESSGNYVSHFNGKICYGSLFEGEFSNSQLDISELDKKLSNSVFKREVLSVTSKRGHTCQDAHTEAFPIQEYLDLKNNPAYKRYSIREMDRVAAVSNKERYAPYHNAGYKGGIGLNIVAVAIFFGIGIALSGARASILSSASSASMPNLPLLTENDLTILANQTVEETFSNSSLTNSSSLNFTEVERIALQVAVSALLLLNETFHNSMQDNNSANAVANWLNIPISLSVGILFIIAAGLWQAYRTSNENREKVIYEKIKEQLLWKSDIVEEIKLKDNVIKLLSNGEISLFDVCIEDRSDLIRLMMPPNRIKFFSKAPEIGSQKVVIDSHFDIMIKIVEMLEKINDLSYYENLSKVLIHPEIHEEILATLTEAIEQFFSRKINMGGANTLLDILVVFENELNRADNEYPKANIENFYEKLIDILTIDLSICKEKENIGYTNSFIFRPR